MINISYFYDLMEYTRNVAGWAPADLYFVPMPVRTSLPPNANFGLSDWSYWSSGLIYVSGLDVSI